MILNIVIKNFLECVHIASFEISKLNSAAKELECWQSINTLLSSDIFREGRVHTVHEELLVSLRQLIYEWCNIFILNSFV